MLLKNHANIFFFFLAKLGGVTKSNKTNDSAIFEELWLIYAETKLTTQVDKEQSYEF